MKGDDMKMRHISNEELPIRTYRIVCSSCGKIFERDKGGYTEGGVAALKYKDKKCPCCNGEIILETNPENVKNKYDETNPYPQ